MPSQAGKSRAAFSANVSELMHAYAAKGKIGNSAPASNGKALKQSLAIAYAQKRKTIAHGR